MSMNRRNVLVGLGTIVAGGGAALGTGAFSSVEASRDVTVSVAGDGAGLLGLSDEASDETAYTDASSITNNTLELTFDSLGSSSGVNLDASTTFDPLFRIINNGSSTAAVSIDSDDASISEDPSILTNASSVIANNISDGTNKVDIEYDFQKSNGDSIVGDGDATGGSVSIGSEGEEEITLVIGVGVPDDGFDPNAVAADEYISSITIRAEES